MDTPEQKIIAHFRNSMEQKKLYHSTLLVSPDTSVLENLVKNISLLLFCSKNQSCGNCPECRKVREGIHPDLVIVSPGEKKQISIDQIREVSREARLRPWEAQYKLFVLDQAQRLGIEAANSLLKTLEEPPEHALFLLLAEYSEGIPDTILSRCQIFSLGNLDSEQIRELLLAHDISPSKAQIAATLADGSFSLAQEIAEQYWDIRHKLLKVVDQTQEPISIAEALTQFCGSGEEGRRKALKLLGHMASLLRDLLLLKMVHSGEQYTINQDFLPQLHECTKRYTIAQLLAFFEYLLAAKDMVRSNVSLGLVWENISLYLHAN